MNRKLTIIITLVIGALSMSCEKDPEPLYTNGMVTGLVRTWDRDTLANAKVTAYGPYGSQSAMTGSDGTYELPGLGNGTYEIEFSKEGYGTKYRQGIQVLGNDTVTLEDARLYKKPDYKMPEIDAVLNPSLFTNLDEKSIAIRTDIPKDSINKEVPIRIFINDTKDVSHKSYKHSALVYDVKAYKGTLALIANANPEIDTSDDEYLFIEEQTLYLIAYVCSIDERYGEFNAYYGVPVFSTVDEQQHSRIIEFKAP